MSILVTGGMGWIASFVTRRLVAIRVQPVAYSRHKVTLLLKDIEEKVIFVEGDIHDLEKLVRTIKTYGVDRIFTHQPSSCME